MPPDHSKISERLEESLRLHREGNLDAARRGYLGVLQDIPEHPGALNLLGTLDAQTGNLDDAERLIRRAIVHSSKEAAYYSNLANVLQEKKQFKDAIQAYRHALKLDPELADALNNLGALLLDAGHADEAQTCFNRALKIKGGTPEIHNNLGRALNNLRRHDEAVKEFQNAIALNEAFAPAHLNLGFVLRAQQKFTAAAASFHIAIQHDPQLHRAYHGLGTVYMAQNTPEQAVECFEKALELKADDYDILIDLGVLLHSLGKLHQSVESYKKAIEIRPNSALAYNNLGAVLVERRNQKAAESAFRQSIQIDPAFIDPYAHLGAMFDEQGRLAEMQAVIEGGLQINPDHKQLNFEAARLAVRRGDMQAAIDLLSRFDLTTLAPRLAQQYRYELGRACDRAGDPGMAYLHASEANRLAAQNWRAQSVDLQSVPTTIARLHEFFTGSESSISSWLGHAAEAVDAPVFLLGFPGTGVDAVAESLRHHSAVQLAPNSSALSAVISVASRYDSGYPDCMASMSDEQLQELRTVYFSQIGRIMEREADTVLLDNQSINTLHSGMIARLFPGARVIYLQRHPCDVVLSNFLQNYSMNDTNAHFLTLEGGVSLYENLNRLWQVYAAKLPLSIFTLRYESLLSEFKPLIESTLKFMGLEADNAILDYIHRVSEGSETTTSSFRLQSNPLDAHNRFRWRAYANQLRPYFGRLQPYIDYYSYDLDSDTGAGPH